MNIDKYIYTVLVGVFCFNSTTAHVSTVNGSTSPEVTTNLNVNVNPGAKLSMTVTSADGTEVDEFGVDGGHYGGQPDPVFIELGWETTGNIAIITQAIFDGISDSSGSQDASYDLSELPISIQFAPTNYITTAQAILEDRTGYEITLSDANNKGMADEFQDHGVFVFPGISNSLIAPAGSNPTSWEHSANLAYIKNEFGNIILDELPFMNTLAYRTGDPTSPNSADFKKDLSRSAIIQYIPGVDMAMDFLYSNPSYARTKQGSDVYQLGFFYESDQLHDIPALDANNEPIKYKIRLESTLIDINSDFEFTSFDASGELIIDLYEPHQSDQTTLSQDSSELLNQTLETHVFEPGDAANAFDTLYNPAVQRQMIKTYRD